MHADVKSFISTCLSWNLLTISYFVAMISQTLFKDNQAYISARLRNGVSIEIKRLLEFASKHDRDSDKNKFRKRLLTL